jgi:uncharacterized membrane protein
MTMPDYVLLKILHMSAAALVVVGVLLSTFAVAHPPPAARLAALRRWDRFVTGPALAAVWGLGITLAVEGGWFHSGWLPVKLTLVLALSALHGMAAGSMKRLARGDAVPAFLRFGPPLVIGCVAAILALVETKPF